MPNEKTGELSQEERDLVKAWVLEKAPHLACPSCHSKQWSVARNMSQIPVKPLFAQITYPAVLLICQVCALMLPFGAVRLGIVPPAKEVEDAE